MIINSGSKQKKRIAVLASGNGSNLQAIIDAQKRNYFLGLGEVVLVVSDRKDAFALERARREGIPAVFHNPLQYPGKKEYDAALLKILQQNHIQLIVLAGYMRMLTAQVIEAFYPAILNIHPSLLPSFPGKQGVQDALDYGVKITGATVHIVNEEMDKGPIILQKAVPVQDDDDVEKLHGRIQEVEHYLYPEAIKLFCQGRLILKGRRCYIKNE
ncbi:MAG: phosphoribosylglycinamide formyltransferase [Firmicutes bacterium]|jgi:phosphoribosylglycinamide formyltransferase-1|nr:phosphoribosylglycinamide formyltransferase [Bacillota bacterium]